jgi:cytidylate kinase
MNNKIAITISRQYGSGGREIGVKLAEMLGIKSYDKELIDIVSQKSGIATDVLQSADEKAANSLLYTLATGSSMHGSSLFGIDIPINDKLFIAQSGIIKEIAENESCIIIGRCADYVLRKNPQALKFFIYADIDSRIDRISTRQNISASQAKSLIESTDKRRSSYYNFYTGRKWGRFEYYDVSINSSLLGIEKTAQVLYDIVQTRMQSK